MFEFVILCESLLGRCIIGGPQRDAGLTGRSGMCRDLWYVWVDFSFALLAYWDVSARLFLQILCTNFL